MGDIKEYVMLDLGIEGLNPALVASLLAALVSLAGLMVVVVRAGSAVRFSPYVASLAAGLVLTTAVFLFSEAMDYGHYTPYLVMLGYIFLFSLNNLFGRNNAAGLVIVPIVAIGLHSFLDGVEYGILFNVNTNTALLASAGLILHEFAESVVLYVLLTRAKVSRFLAFILTFSAAGMTTPLGAFTAEPLLENASPELFGHLVAIATGALLYVGTTHLIDHVKDARHKSRAMLFYLIGVSLALVASYAHMSGEHEHHDHHDDDHAQRTEEVPQNLVTRSDHWAVVGR